MTPPKPISFAGCRSYEDAELVFRDHLEGLAIAAIHLLPDDLVDDDLLERQAEAIEEAMGQFRAWVRLQKPSAR